MSKPNIVYLDVWTGDPARARELVAARYPDADLVELSHRELRDGGWKGQVKALRVLRGRALVSFFASFVDCKQTELIRWSGLLHRCSETAIVDQSSDWQIYRRRDWFWMLPKTVVSLLADAGTFVFWLFYLAVWKLRARSVEGSTRGLLDIAYLFPYPLNTVTAGGAASHIRGFLGGLATNRANCRIFSGTSLPVDVYPVELVPVQRKLFVFWESVMLSYNFGFARAVRQKLQGQRPALLYQRHGRFSVAGAVLARRMSVPLVLEYNGSEVWIADHWHPARFRTWLRLCEQVMLNCASLVVVVSEALKDELIGRGVPANHVLVNPNAVDTEYFHPGCGGEQVRKELGFSSREVVVEFVGTFSYWHGIAVLQYGIECLLQNDKLDRLRFLLVGGGPLHSEIREYLRQYEASGKVIFTDLISHDKVRAYLDAADILVSPHVPMPDGSPFFGSPTKLFEYMSMGKAIVASDLDQLAKVLRHNETGILVQPGDASQFIEAVQLLAADSHLRASLGRRSREVAIECHTWTHNARSVLAAMRDVSLHVPNESLGEPAVSERG
jgi:glycosyltransferase involved in cell wall biosynthesis